MALTFANPSMRASGTDLAIQISPLGLIELSDEEFEVHGPRLNRYAQNWAFYLGHHWSYMKAPGEFQTTVNYVRAMSDWMTNFVFGKGVDFKCDPEFQHIVPALLDRVWDTDNNKAQVLWELGNMGSVQGDAFVKVCYDPTYQDASGMAHPGRVRILPLNGAFCFPEWHPHDRGRLQRFKLKYRFWDTSPEGTRQLNTYVEVLTDEYIEEYLNDKLIDRRANPIGQIPIVHISNKIASASPFGLSDIHDIIDLNRCYNELMTEIQEIIAYYTAPVTIITGSRPASLDRGANNVWALPDPKSHVENLTGGSEGLPQALETLDKLELAMHKMMGIPASALGEELAVSNTSGVALAIQFQPAMNMHSQKVTQYSEALRRINALILRHLFIFEPDTIYYDPDTNGIKQDGQPDFVDPEDPAVYDIECSFPPPLPVDRLIKLNEIQVMMALGLMSKIGALRDLGEEFPDEKLAELAQEQIDDEKQSAAQSLIRAHMGAVTQALTGIVPEGAGDPAGAEPTKNADGSTTEPAPPPVAQNLPKLPELGDIDALMQDQMTNMFSDIVTRAYGTKMPQRRQVDKNDNDND